MNYISRHTGEAITELEHVKESIVDILTTAKTTRVRLMEYGTNIYQMLDRPINRELISDLRMEIAEAIDRWEPRVTLNEVKLDLTSIEEGVLYVSLTCTYKPTGGRVEFNSLELKYRRIAA